MPVPTEEYKAEAWWSGQEHSRVSFQGSDEARLDFLILLPLPLKR